MRMEGSSPWWDTCHMVKGCHCFCQKEKKSCLWLTLVWFQSQQEHKEDESDHPCTLRYPPPPPLTGKKSQFKAPSPIELGTFNVQAWK